MTYTIEALMRDGKALQAGTSHNLGQHFAKVFDITFQDEQGKRQHVWQTSWGCSTRLIGARDHGARRRPGLEAPAERRAGPGGGGADLAQGRRSARGARVRRPVKAALAAGALHVDDRDQYTPGWKYNEYELRGVPVRLEIGPRDVARRR
jgi:prolyl-tRNA synthetase